jgi:hypothetical protein
LGHSVSPRKTLLRQSGCCLGPPIATSRCSHWSRKWIARSVS